MLLHKSVEHDSRVRRAARALAAAGHEVTVLHLPRLHGELDGPLDGFSVRSVTPPAWVRHRLPSTLYRLVFFAAFVRAARRLHPDVVHAHDAAMLAPGWAAARLTGAKLVYDSHEYAAGVPYRNRTWTLLVTALERLLIRRCAATITVSDGIADRLQARYALRNRPIVVRNIPDPAEHDPDFEAPDLRDSLGIAPGTPLVLHLGAVARDRGCENLVRAMAELDGAHLLFLGADDSAYASGLRELAGAEGVGERTHFRPSVPVAQIRAHTRQASVGVSLLEDTCENHRLALPNKVFEYIAAGVPVVVSDLPELRRLLGGDEGTHPVDSTDPVAVGAALRQASNGTAKPSLTGIEWAAEAERLGAVYEHLDTGRCDGRGRALVLVRNGVSHDARILREAGLLDSIGFDVTVAGVVTGTDTNREEWIGGSRIVRIDPGGRLRRTLGRFRSLLGSTSKEAAGGSEPASGASSAAPQPASTRARLRRLATTAAYYREGLGQVRDLRPDLIHANDYNTAWIGVAGKWLTGARLVYDSHELWPDRNLRPESRPWLLLCEALFVRAADEVITTSPGYAQVLSRRYRIPTPRVIRNVVDWRVEPAPDRPSEGAPLAVYFGAITRNRGLATALRALALVPELRMRFVGPEAWRYRTELRALAEELGVAERLELLDPVPPEQAPSVLADADIGLALIEPACLSYEMTLPNKLYEYVAAGLPVLASEVPVLAAEVHDNELGLLADPSDPAAVAAAIRAMLEPKAQRRFREAATCLSAEVVWDREREGLAAVYESLS